MQKSFNCRDEFGASLRGSGPNKSFQSDMMSYAREFPEKTSIFRGQHALFFARKTREAAYPCEVERQVAYEEVDVSVGPVRVRSEILLEDGAVCGLVLGHDVRKVAEGRLGARLACSFSISKRMV
eukprot:6197677-Pleurochrysis_carterae.AAC.1